MIKIWVLTDNVLNNYCNTWENSIFPAFPALLVANWVLQGRILEIKIIQIHKFAKSGKAGKHKEHISIEQPIFSSKKEKGYKKPTTYQALLYFNNFCF